MTISAPRKDRAKVAQRYYTFIKDCIRALIHKGKREKRNIMSFEQSYQRMIEMREVMPHIWKCANTPGQYICPCGATGLWNSELQKVEVEFPMPYETMKIRHKTHLDMKKKGVEIAGEKV